MALDIFVHRLRSSIGAMLASLGGLDGVWQRSAKTNYLELLPVTFEFLGLRLDKEKMPACLLLITAWRIQR